MNFGDVLDQWSDLKKNEKKKQGSTAKKLAPGPTKSDDTQEWSAFINRYGVVNKDEELDAEESAEEERSISRERLAQQKPDSVIDLHGLSLEEAERRLSLFMADASRRGDAKVLIIHGKGTHSADEPVLRRAVQKFLETCPVAGKRGFADKRQGGNGATWVMLKKK